MRVDASHIRAFLLAEEQRTSAASAAVHFRNIRVFFGWLASEGERENPNPMDRVEAPKVTKKAKAFFTEEELARLLKTCSDTTFVDRRDTAIMRVFIDTGLRVSGLAGLRYDPDDESANDVFLGQRRLRIRLKGGDETWVPIGKKSAAALDKCIRARARHSQNVVAVALAWRSRAQHGAHDGLRYPRHGGAQGRAGGNSERTSAQVPAIVRGQLARGRRIHRRPHAHHRVEDLRTWSASTPRRGESRERTMHMPASALVTASNRA